MPARPVPPACRSRSIRARGLARSIPLPWAELLATGLLFAALILAAPG